MNSTTKSTRRPTITLALPRSVPALISYAQGVVTRMTGNPSFPAPVPTLAAVTAAVADLQTAETAALARTKGAVTRDGRPVAAIRHPLSTATRRS